MNALVPYSSPYGDSQSSYFFKDQLAAMAKPWEQVTGAYDYWQKHGIGGGLAEAAGTTKDTLGLQPKPDRKPIWPFLLLAAGVVVPFLVQAWAERRGKAKRPTGEGWSTQALRGESSYSRAAMWRSNPGDKGVPWWLVLAVTGLAGLDVVTPGLPFPGSPAILVPAAGALWLAKLGEYGVSSGGRRSNPGRRRRRVRRNGCSCR